MDELLISILLVVIVAAVLSAIVLPIIALVISIRSRSKLTEQISTFEGRYSAQVSGAPQQLTVSGETSSAATIQELEWRIERLEAALAAHSILVRETVDERPVIEQTAERSEGEPVPQVESPFEPQSPAPVVPGFTPLVSAEPRSPVIPSFLLSTRKIQSEQIESIIGRRGLGWAAVCLILFAAAFFLKYAFDNRWIGELGRVAIGVAAGISMTVFGFKYHKRGWRVFSQILTGGGVVLLYLSAYAAF